jgi:hypothetical protein
VGKMNVARKTDMKTTAYENQYIKKSTRTNGAEIISLESKKNLVDKKGAEIMTMEYLNGKLTYFYNNGGPIMDI